MTSGALHATPSENHGGRASGPGRRWALAAVVLAVALAGGLVFVLSSSATSKPKVGNSYGHMPAWLPKSATPTRAAPQLEQATAAHPVLSEEQGYTVHAVLPSGSADVTAVGPGFPGYVTNYASRGLWPTAKPVPSTFYVTIAAVKGTIPLTAAAFSVENQAYQQEQATVSLKGGGKAPLFVRSGQQVTLAVHSTTLEGQGALAWTPVGQKPLVAWIYQVELD